MSITDANFVFVVVSDGLAIVSLNSNYSTSNSNWGPFPAIPSVYTGINNTYNGNGNSANAHKVVEIMASAFDSKTAFSETTLSATFLGSNMKRIGERAFSGVKLKGTLTIPATIESVGYRAFYNCTLITNVTIGSGATNSDIVAHLANLTATINQEITDRNASYDQLNLLKAPIENATFTGTATISNAIIDVATITSASIASANMTTANITSASIASVNVIGNAAFGGTVSTTGQWNFTVQPKYETNVMATESYVNSKISNIAGGSLSAALDTLSELASAVGNDPSFATNIINTYISLSGLLSTEVVTRSTAVSSLSTLLSTSAASLTVVDSALSTALSTEISTRSTAASSISSSLRSAASSLTVVDSAISTGLSNEIGARASAVLSISSALSNATASLVVANSGLSTALSTEISTRASAVASVAPLITGSIATLSTSDVNLSTALSTETSTRSTSASSISSATSSAASSLTAVGSTLSTTLSNEINARSGAVSSLSVSASGAADSLQITNLGFSIALATEVGVRSTSISSLSTSTSVSVSTLTSANSSISTALGTEVAARISMIASASASIGNLASTMTTSNTAQSNTLATETAVRSGQFVSISSTVSGSVASLSVANAAVSTALAAETTNRSNAITAAINNVISGAPSRMNTLNKIVSELQGNSSVIITSSTINRVSTLSSAVSAENSTRISAIASLSNSAIASLAAVDAGMSTSLSNETSTRVGTFASLSTTLSSASVSFVGVDTVLSTALSAEISNRANAIVSVSTAISNSNSSLTGVNSTLSLALSAEISNRQTAIVSMSSTMSTSVLSLTSVNSALSTALSNEVSTRVASIASVSAGIVASMTALQTTNTTLNTSITNLSTALSSKATTSYLDTQISNLLSGAPNNLNTLGELAAALNNNPSYASSITSLLSTKVDIATVSTLSATVAGKANASDLSTLSTTVSNKADITTITAVDSSVSTINNTATTLLSLVSTLKATGGTINANALSVGGVTISDITNRVQELYYNLGTANPSWGIMNADGTINHKLNRMANPSLVSTNLSFEYDANNNVTKVIQLVTIMFDKNQTSATKTGGVGNPTVAVNLVLDSNGNCIIPFPYIGDADYYTANKTGVSVTALDSQYKMAPASPTISVSALNISDYKYAIPVVTTPYASTTWDNAAQLITQAITVTTQYANVPIKFNLGVYTTSNITIQVASGATVVAGKTNQFTLTGTSATFNVRYAPSLVGTGDNKIYVGVMGTYSMIASNLLTISGVINAGPTYATPTVTTPYAAYTWDDSAQLITQPVTVATQDANSTLKFDLGSYSSTSITIEAASGASAVAGQTNQFAVSGTSATFNLKYAPDITTTSLVSIGYNSATNAISFTLSQSAYNDILSNAKYNYISIVLPGMYFDTMESVFSDFQQVYWMSPSYAASAGKSLQPRTQTFTFTPTRTLLGNRILYRTSARAINNTDTSLNQYNWDYLDNYFSVSASGSVLNTGDLAVNVMTSVKIASNICIISGAVNNYPRYATPTLVSGSKTVTLSGSTYTLSASFDSVSAYNLYNASNQNITNSVRPPNKFVLRTTSSDWRYFMRQAYPDTSASYGFGNYNTTYAAWTLDANVYYASSAYGQQFTYFALYWLKRLKIPVGQYLSVPIYTARNYTYWNGVFTSYVSVADTFAGYFVFGKISSQLTFSFSSLYSGTRYIATETTANTNDANAAADAENNADTGTLRILSGLPDWFSVRTGTSPWRTYIPYQTAVFNDLQSWGPDSQFYDPANSPANQISIQFAYFAQYWLNRLNIPIGQIMSVNVSSSGGIFSFWKSSSTTYQGNYSGYNGNTYTLVLQQDAVDAGIAAQPKYVASITYTSASIGQPVLKVKVPTGTNILSSNYLVINGESNV